MNTITGERTQGQNQGWLFPERICEIPGAIFDGIRQRVVEIVPFAENLADRVVQLVCPIFKIIIASVLLAAQSTLFTVGFLTGVINPGAIKTATQRICDVWNRQSGLGHGLIIAGAVLAWPITLAASAFFVGGNLGVYCGEPAAEDVS